MVELEDTTDLKSVDQKWSCEFDSRFGHEEFNQNSLTLVLLNKPIWRLVNLLTLYIPIASELNKGVLNGAII